MGELIAVLSGKGGTGKTSICAAVAIALASSGAKVLCIDCDVGLRNLDLSLGMSDICSLSFLDIMERNYPLSFSSQHPTYPTLSFLTAPINRPVEEINPIAFGNMLQEARKLYDYVFLDAPAGVDAGFRLVAAPADRILLVTGPGPAAIRDAARVGELLELMGKQNTRLIVNRVQKSILSQLKVTIDDVMDTAGLPLLGIVLEDPNVTLSASFGMPLQRYSNRSPAMVACRKIAKRIQGQPVPITYR